MLTDVQLESLIKTWFSLRRNLTSEKIKVKILRRGASETDDNVSSVIIGDENKILHWREDFSELLYKSFVADNFIICPSGNT